MCRIPLHNSLEYKSVGAEYRGAGLSEGRRPLCDPTNNFQPEEERLPQIRFRCSEMGGVTQLWIVGFANAVEAGLAKLPTTIGSWATPQAWANVLAP